MFVLGLLLVGAGALLILAAIFTAETTGTGAAVEILDTEVDAMTLFFLGVGAGVAILLGIWLVRLGVRRTLRRRREQSRLRERSQKLDDVEAERRGDDGEPHV